MVDPSQVKSCTLCNCNDFKIARYNLNVRKALETIIRGLHVDL